MKGKMVDLHQNKFILFENIKISSRNIELKTTDLYFDQIGSDNFADLVGADENWFCMMIGAYLFMQSADCSAVLYQWRFIMWKWNMKGL